MTTWKILRTAMALALIALSAISAEAQEPGESASHKDCTNSNIGEYAECALSRLMILESELKVVYSATLAKVAPTSAKEIKNRIERSQSAWIGFRDADCLLRGAEMYGSAGHDLLLYQCRLEHTDQRIKHLRSLAI